MQRLNMHFAEVYDTTKYLLTSYAFAGSNFVRETLRQNFPELIDPALWGKTHSMVSSEDVDRLKAQGVKIIFVMCDPRDIAARLGYLENAWNCPPHFYNKETGLDLRDTNEFLEFHIEYTIELYNFYKFNFGDDFICINYEDVVYNFNSVLDEVQTFFNYEPLYIDSASKYSHSNFKTIGIFKFYYDNSMITANFTKYENFYIEIGYDVDGYVNNRYPNLNPYEDFGAQVAASKYPVVNLRDFLRQHKIEITAELEERIAGITDL